MAKNWYSTSWTWCFFQAHAAFYLKEAMSLYWGDLSVVCVSLRSMGMGDIPVQQDFLHKGLKMSVLGLNAQLIDVVKMC